VSSAPKVAVVYYSSTGHHRRRRPSPTAGGHAVGQPDGRDLSRRHSPAPDIPLSKLCRMQGQAEAKGRYPGWRPRCR
jgi:hypothetical protein